MKNYLIVALLASTTVLSIMWRNRVNEVQRLSSNQNVLLDSMTHYKTCDSLNALSLGLLEIKVRELKEYRAEDAEMIRSLGLKLRRVESISKVFTQSQYRVEIPPLRKDSNILWHYQSKWMELTANKRQDTLHTEVIVYDTIFQVLHRVPRFKFLGINFGVRGVRQEIISRNPHTKIVAAEYLDIIR